MRLDCQQHTSVYGTHASLVIAFADIHLCDMHSIIFRAEGDAAFVLQALGKACSLHIVPRSTIFTRKEPARQRVMEHSCAPDAALGDIQVSNSGCRIVITDLLPLHIVRGPCRICGRCLATLDFEIAALSGVL